jgi:hypothetical protein
MSGALESGLAHLALEQGDLVPQRYILQAKLVMSLQPRQKVAQECQSNRQHGGSA